MGFNSGFKGIIYVIQRYMIRLNEPSSDNTLQKIKNHKYVWSMHYYLLRSHWLRNIY